MTFELRFPANQVDYWASRYSYGGDSDSLAIGARSRQARFYTKADFIAVCDWKTRGRPRRHYLRNSAEEIQLLTHIALTGTGEERRIQSLLALHGVRLPTASMLMHLAYPESYADAREAAAAESCDAEPAADRPRFSSLTIARPWASDQLA